MKRCILIKEGAVLRKPIVVSKRKTPNERNHVQRFRSFFLRRPANSICRLAKSRGGWAWLIALTSLSLEKKGDACRLDQNPRERWDATVPVN